MFKNFIKLNDKKKKNIFFFKNSFFFFFFFFFFFDYLNLSCWDNYVLKKATSKSKNSYSSTLFYFNESIFKKLKLSTKPLKSKVASKALCITFNKKRISTPKLLNLFYDQNKVHEKLLKKKEKKELLKKEEELQKFVWNKPLKRTFNIKNIIDFPEYIDTVDFLYAGWVHPSFERKKHAIFIKSLKDKNDARALNVWDYKFYKLVRTSGFYKLVKKNAFKDKLQVYSDEAFVDLLSWYYALKNPKERKPQHNRWYHYNKYFEKNAKNIKPLFWNKVNKWTEISMVSFNFWWKKPKHLNITYKMLIRSEDYSNRLKYKFQWKLWYNYIYHVRIVGSFWYEDELKVRDVDLFWKKENKRMRKYLLDDCFDTLKEMYIFEREKTTPKLAMLEVTNYSFFHPIHVGQGKIFADWYIKLRNAGLEDHIPKRWRQRSVNIVVRNKFTGFVEPPVFSLYDYNK